jgi:large subunit ribosomal protein L4
MVRLALQSALSDRACEGRVKVVDDWGIDEPKTKRGVEVLQGLGLREAGARPPRVLLVLDRTEHPVWKSFRNLGDRVQIVLPEELNAYDVLLSDWVVFSKPTLEAAVARFSGKSEKSERAVVQVDDAPSGADDAASDAAEGSTE